ncbi:GRF zinc finger domain-containing protein [Eremomyces bilateralis CBS 781.70]|uniref:GRF zinc finger domain-containing protein n=1 Tax=Eremomyces bilateralis CBS 781.70 TaxID=1392243 RepID=A0A6G1FYJ0_9PEZI|nr:GRF zinc finger domain-containing protein [Eremomyces bilateralis CBS 781.70]KAF1810770.1 GRF zinc finger domain-containing protein [Eremomyces bilateralis CBS 781.70]
MKKWLPFMEHFILRKRRRTSPIQYENKTTEEEESTDFKLAILCSQYPELDESALLETLLACEGSVEAASEALEHGDTFRSPKKRDGSRAIQSSLSSFGMQTTSAGLSATHAKKKLTRKGRTLHLYAPADIEAHTPCSIIHNFLPTEEADALLKELLQEAVSYQSEVFKLFDNVVQSPHTNCFYVDSLEEAQRQKTEYTYNGSRVKDVREITPEMRKVRAKVQKAVNTEIERRVRDYYPEGKKLKYQSPHPWEPNAAFVNCYDGPHQSVGYHADQLTYLGPRAVIGSLSLGVAREFRVRRVLAKDDESESDNKTSKPNEKRADAEGQIAIHLPHNSLLVMHAEMQEEWKHSIAPAQAIDPHPLAQNKRINVTYRHYKNFLHPKYTPLCKCGVSCILRCAMKKPEHRGRYMWMCHTNYAPGKEGCSYFKWAEFNDDGEPEWATSVNREQSSPKEQ